MCKFVETAGMVKLRTNGAGVGVGEMVGVGVTVGVGEIVGVGERVGVGDNVGVGETVGVGDRVGVGESVGVGDKEGVGAVVVIALADSPLSPAGVDVASEEFSGFVGVGVPSFHTVIEFITSADGLEKEPDSIETKKHAPVTAHPIRMRRNFFIFDESSTY